MPHSNSQNTSFYGKKMPIFLNAVMLTGNSKRPKTGGPISVIAMAPR
jgi:hypothetical protein